MPHGCRAHTADLDSLIDSCNSELSAANSEAAVNELKPKFFGKKALSAE